jgi:hypothetical protein
MTHISESEVARIWAGLDERHNGGRLNTAGVNTAGRLGAGLAVGLFISRHATASSFEDHVQALTQRPGERPERPDLDVGPAGLEAGDVLVRGPHSYDDARARPSSGFSTVSRPRPTRCP